MLIEVEGGKAPLKSNIFPLCVVSFDEANQCPVGTSWTGETQVDMLRKKEYFTPQEKSDEKAQHQPQ
jgi:hypothetical protein